MTSPPLGVTRTLLAWPVDRSIRERQSNGSIRLLDAAVAYGCTEPSFLVREPLQRRTTQLPYDEFLRPSFWHVDLNFAKATPITNRVRLRIRIEAFNLLNSPMHDERRGDFGRSNRNSTGQSNFHRFVQLGFRLTF